MMIPLQSTSRILHRTGLVLLLSIALGGAFMAPAHAADGPWNHRVLLAKDCWYEEA